MRRKHKHRRRWKYAILPFRCVKLSVPRGALAKLFYSKRTLAGPQITKMRAKLREIEMAQNQINHVYSIVEQILSRAGHLK